MTHLTNTTKTPLSSVFDDAEERGTITDEELEELALEHDLEFEDLADVRAELEARDVEIVRAPES